MPDLARPSAYQRTTFRDPNRLRSPESLTQVFGYEATVPRFTDTQQLVFATAMKDTPKNFGRIAALLPGRTIQNCIDHYYENKWDSRFKTESDDEDTDVIPIDRRIGRLRSKVGNTGRLYRKAYPTHAQEPVMLPRPDLSVLRPSFQPPLHLSDEQLLVWLRSADVLPLVKRWKEQCLDVDEVYVTMQSLLAHPEERGQPLPLNLQTMPTIMESRSLRWLSRTGRPSYFAETLLPGSSMATRPSPNSAKDTLFPRKSAWRQESASCSLFTGMSGAIRMVSLPS